MLAPMEEAAIVALRVQARLPLDDAFVALKDVFRIPPARHFTAACSGRFCQDFRVSLGGCTLRCHSFDEAFAEDDGELGLGHGPLTWRARCSPVPRTGCAASLHAFSDRFKAR
mgnify:CR=1 FL=1